MMAVEPFRPFRLKNHHNLIFNDKGYLKLPNRDRMWKQMNNTYISKEWKSISRSLRSDRIIYCENLDSTTVFSVFV